MTKMSGDMLKFVKGWQPKIDNVNLSEMLNEIDRIVCKTASDKGIEYKIKIPEDLPLLQCDSQMVHSAVMDIVSNALDACTWKDYKTEEIPAVKMNVFMNGQENVIIKIEDNGCATRSWPAAAYTST